MRLGIFGGTFDPPHNGHLILASEAIDQLGLDRLLWVLTPEPPHKTGNVVLSMPERLELLQAAIGSNQVFELSPVEINRPGPHFAADTMHQLSVLYPEDELFYLIGGDSLHDLPHWYHPDELIRRCTGLGVMRRPQDSIDLTELEKALPGITEKIIYIKTPLLEISSSDIRSRIQNHKHYQYYLPSEVYRIIKKRNYYQS